MGPMKVAHIVAAAKNGVIGQDGDLPWSIPEDMKWFRERTKGRALIMGRKTYESLGHPLPYRLNVVVTRDPAYKAKGEPKENAPTIIVQTIEQAMEACKKQIDQYNDEIFIIGGGEIYKQTVGLVDTIYLTRIHKDVDGDTTYPDPTEDFKLVEEIKKTDPVPFSFLTYQRV